MQIMIIKISPAHKTNIYFIYSPRVFVLHHLIAIFAIKRKRPNIYLALFRMKIKYLIVIIVLLIEHSFCHAQTFSLIVKSDSLAFLVLKSDSTTDQWRLPYPTYRFCTGDVDGDGKTDAMVGVINSTRFYPQKGKRLFVFKNKNGRVRPLWLGSKLGGILQDFRFINGRIRSLETTTDRKYVVAEYVWQVFGFSFERFIAKGVKKDVAVQLFNN